MKEDYLWDKTGEDAEIQALENALKAFRCTETAPPELPQKVFTLKKSNGRRFFRKLGFGFAAFAAVVALFSVIWFQAANNKIPVAETVAEINAPPADDKIGNEEIIKTPEIAPVENPQRAAKPGVVKARQKSAPIINVNKAVLRDTKPKEPAETLTAEEKYAYDQLMLALSITGSKLRIVKDKINGIEDQNAALETAR